MITDENDFLPQPIMNQHLKSTITFLPFKANKQRMQGNVNSYLLSEYPNDEVLKQTVCLITFDAWAVLDLKIHPQKREF